MDSVAEIQDAGLHRVGASRTILRIVSSTYNPDDSLYIVEIESEDAAGSLQDADGNVVQSADAATSSSGYTVEFVGPYDWRTISFGLIEATDGQSPEPGYTDHSP